MSVPRMATRTKDGELPRHFFRMQTVTGRIGPGFDEDHERDMAKRRREASKRHAPKNGDLPRDFFRMGTVGRHIAPGFEERQAYDEDGDQDDD